VTLTSREYCSRLQQMRCHAVIHDWIIPFAAYTAAEIPSAFQCVGPPSRPHLLHDFSASRESAPQTASRSVQPFLHGSPMCPMNRHADGYIDHVTCFICSSRPHLCLEGTAWLTDSGCYANHSYRGVVNQPDLVWWWNSRMYYINKCSFRYSVAVDTERNPLAD